MVRSLKKPDLIKGASRAVCIGRRLGFYMIAEMTALAQPRGDPGFVRVSDRGVRTYV